MTKFRLFLLTIALAPVVLANPVAPTPFGTIAGVALTGTGSGQFTQSSSQAGEIEFHFTLNNGEIISGQVCSFGAATCVANGTGAIFDPAAPDLFMSVSVGCGQANCAPVSYDLSATYELAGDDIASDSVSGSFSSNDIVGMNPSDAVSFQGAINGITIVPSGGFSISPTGGVKSFPFSHSDGPDTVANGGNTVTANLSGSFTIAGPEDTLLFSGDVGVRAAQTPEPAGLALGLIGILSTLVIRYRKAN